MWRYLGLILLMAMAGCASRAPAPVADRTAPTVVEAGAVPVPAAVPAVAREGYYIVKRGDTLRRIAKDHGQDFRELAAWNNIENPSKIEPGQELRVIPPEGQAVVKPVAAPAPVLIVGEGKPAASPSGDVAVPVAGGSTDLLKREPKGGKIVYSEVALAQVRAMEGVPASGKAAETKSPPKTADKPGPEPMPIPGAATVDWTWPVAGKVIGEFVEGAGGKESNKGIDLAGRLGEPIQAAASGKVTYVGSLRGYGDFVVVRHNNDFISVYAHTSKILVKKDQMVAKGQKIAEVGSSDAEQPKLHFEIRLQSKPVDPLKLLPARQ
jgi:lipoprotein NlpD